MGRKANILESIFKISAISGLKDETLSKPEFCMKNLLLRRIKNDLRQILLIFLSSPLGKLNTYSNFFPGDGTSNSRTLKRMLLNQVHLLEEAAFLLAPKRKSEIVGKPYTCNYQPLQV